MSEELKPCPFCGQPAKLVWQSFISEAVACENEDCIIGPDAETGPYCWSAEAWNRRPIEDALAARVAELEAERDRLKAELKSTGYHHVTDLYEEEKP